MEDQDRQTLPASASPPDGGPRTATDRGRKHRWEILWPIAIIVTAFVLRLIYVFQFQACPYYSTPAMDPQYHHEWARAFAAGESFWEGPYFRAPLYPWFLGIIYWLFGPDNPLAPRIVQAVLGSLSCGLLYLIGRQVFSRTVGVIAGFAAATYWVFLYFDAELLIPVLIVFLDLVLLWLLLRARDRRSPLLWGACGLALGLSAIARPNILLFAPAVVIWIVVLHRPQWRRALGYAFCLFLGCILPIVPITIRNYVVGKDLVLIASQGGVNFFIGNNPLSDGVSAIVRGDPAEWWPCYYAQIARAEQAMGRPLKASEVSRWYFRQALRFIREQPGWAAALMLRKLIYFWSRWEIPNNQDIHFVTSQYTPIVRYLPTKFWLIGPLGALGLCLVLRRAKALFPLWGFVVIYLLTVAMFFATARYRVPVAAVLILLGSQAACWLVKAWRGRRWVAVGLAALVLMVMRVVTYQIPSGIDTQMVQGHRAAGFLLAKQGKFAEAERLLNEAVRRATTTGWPIDAGIWYHLGYILAQQGQLDQAREYLDKTLQVDPNYPKARHNLAVMLTQLGRLDQAAQQLEHIVRRDPEDGGARSNLGSLLAQLGRTNEATGYLLRAIEIDAKHAGQLIETAEALRRRGDTYGAGRLLRTAVERFPDDMSLMAALIELLANQADAAARAEAVQLGRQASERTQGRNAAVLHATALAYFNTGQAEQAVEAERRALEIVTRQGPAALIESYRQSLQQYEAAVRRNAAPAGPP